MFIFLLVGTMTMVQKLGNIARRSAQCRHVVVCTHHIRRKRTWESLLKTIWDWESKPYQVSNMNHTLSKLPIKLHLLVCDVCCCAEARIRLLLFFSVCRAPNCSNACFFPRFVVHQIVLQRCFFSRFVVHQIVFFSFFFWGLSCSNAFLRLVAHQIVLQCV